MPKHHGPSFVSPVTRENLKTVNRHAQKAHFAAAWKDFAYHVRAMYEALDSVMSENNLHPVGRKQLKEHLADTVAAAGPSPETLEIFSRPNAQRIADRIDGYDRDDIGESPDY